MFQQLLPTNPDINSIVKTQSHRQHELFDSVQGQSVTPLAMAAFVLHEIIVYLGV